MQQTLDDPNGGCMAFGSGALAEGTNAATLKTTATIPYMIDGMLYSKAATDNMAITACAQQAALTTCIYLVTLNAAGTLVVTKGREVLTADLAKGADSLQFPTKPASQAVIGFFTIITASGYTYTGGTTDNSATGITDAYYDAGMVPANPRTAA